MTSFKFLLITLLAFMFICSTSVEARPRHHHPKPRQPPRKPAHRCNFKCLRR
ncbi:unnamed protein product, partial [Cylicocyclus nassatus]